MSLSVFFLRLTGSPMLPAAVLLTLGVMFVNGWTDAPNAIATAVATRSIAPRRAIALAAVMNFLGLAVMTALRPAVAETIFRMVDFGGDTRAALAALCAAMAAIVVWAVAAWRFGIPTSESHALIAGLSGAAIASQHGCKAINASEWAKVLWGLGLSAVLGFCLGFFAGKGTHVFAEKITNRGRATGFFRGAQTLAAAGSAFLHGAQDGQKFISVFLLGIYLSEGRAEAQPFMIPLWLMALCAATISLGTSLGGYRIIRSVGFSMVQLAPHEGFAADLAAGICLALSTFGGLPVSTTHTKTMSVAGVGAARSLRRVNWGLAREMGLAWLLTFPGCGLLGWGFALIFMKIFT